MKQSFTVIAIFLSWIKLYNWELSIKGICIYYTNWTDSATLKSAFSSYVWIMFLVFRLSDLWKRWKKHSFHNKHIYMLYGSQTFWSFMKFYFIHMVKVRFVFKKSVIMLMFLHICIKHSKHLEMWKSNSKLNFTKNHWVSWFSCGLLKISKCSISLIWLGECSKIKVTPLNWLTQWTCSVPGEVWTFSLKVSICRFKMVFLKHSSVVTLCFCG